MNAINTARGLEVAANLLDGLPGLPDVYVTVGGTITVQISEGGADEQTRRTAVELVLAIVGGTKAEDRPYEDPASGSYGGHGKLAGFHVTVYTPIDLPAVVPS